MENEDIACDRNDDVEYEVINTVEELRELYDAPRQMVIDKQQDRLDQYSEQFLQLSPFSILSTVSASGLMDCSPKGDYPGFIKVLDDRTIAIPDRPGNNRLDSITNIVENPQIGILLLVPGFGECLRVNGEARIVTNKPLLEQFEYQGKLPKSVIVVAIKEVYFHCAKAIARSQLWKEAAQVDRAVMPSLGRIIMAQVNAEAKEEEVRAVEEGIEERLKTTLY